LADAIDYLAAARQVVAVRTDVDLPADDLDLPAAPADPDAFRALAVELGLGGSADRVLSALARRDQDASPGAST